MREKRALALLVGGLSAAVVVRSAVLPRRWHFPYNLAVGAFAVAVGRLGGLTVDDLGCSPARARDGFRVGGVAFGLISAVLGAAAVAGLLDDDRTQVSGAEMALKALVVIPLGTVLVEELAFRGALHGLLAEVTTPRRGLVAGALLFGLWHLPPIWHEGPGSLAATFAATTVAGAGFTWLRRRSGSIVAPMLAHLATNSTTFALSWASNR